MSEKELKEAVRIKNEIIMRQTRRIRLLEERFSQFRQKYFQMKYRDDKIKLHPHR